MYYPSKPAQYPGNGAAGRTDGKSNVSSKLALSVPRDHSTVDAKAQLSARKED
jgi:hypothetical protein